jgi:hypothetical protein
MIRSPRNRTLTIAPLPGVDLFGEVVVTHADIEAWCNADPRIPASGWRRDAYVRCYRVADKVAEAKKRGAWPL